MDEMTVKWFNLIQKYIRKRTASHQRSSECFTATISVCLSELVKKKKEIVAEW